MVSVNNRAVAAVHRALEALAPLAAVEQSHSTRNPGVDVRYGQALSRLVPLWAGTGYPQDVRRALRELEDYGLREDETPVLAVREMSSGAEKLLGELGVSWVDERGRAKVSAPPALLLTRGPATPLPDKKKPGEREEMAWAEGSAAVAEYLLDFTLTRRGGEAEPVQLPTGSQIAESVGVSTALVSRTFSELDAMEWTEKSGAERGASASRRLVDPTAMLSSWARWHSHRRVETILAHALFQDPHEFVRERIAPVMGSVDWAVTGWLALESRAPFMTSIPRVTFYLDPRIAGRPDLMKHVFTSADLREVERGPRVAIITSDQHVVKRARRGVDFPLVSDIRLYGDLLREGARGPDAAEHLRETRIRF